MNVLEAKKVFLSCVDDLSEPLKSAVEFTLANWHKMEREQNDLDNLPGEEWRDVAGYEEFYKVSNCGRVKSLHFGRERLLKIIINHSGYANVTLTNKNIKRFFFVHVLVAQAFIPNPENKPIVNHIDGNKLNNRADNLEWVTYSENVHHAHKIGLVKVGCEHPKAKLTVEDIRYIKKHYIPRHEEFGAKSLAKRFGVSDSTICNVVYGETYKNVV